MSMTHYSADPGEMSTAGSTLERQADTLSGEKGFGAVAGAAPYPPVTGAVDGFTGSWNPGLGQLGTAITQLGAAARGAAQLITATDEQNSAAWNAVPQPAPTAPGVPAAAPTPAPTPSPVPRPAPTPTG